VGGFVWKLGTHDSVIIAVVTRLVLAAWNDQNVIVRQAPLLPFYHMDVYHHSAQNTILQKVFEEGIELHVEHLGCQVRAVISFLPRP
jgi:hypothetical protein